MRKRILKLIPLLMLVSLTSVGFAFWYITSPTVDTSNKGNVVVDEVGQLEVLSSSYDVVGLIYNKKGFFTQYTYSENLNEFETKTYDNFTYYVSVDLPKVKEFTTIEKAELKIELTSEFIDLKTIKDLIVITCTTGHVISEPEIVDGSLCVYVTFDVTENSVKEKIGINYNLGKVDTKPEFGEEETEEEFFITLSNLSDNESPFVAVASLYSKSND